MIVKPGYNHGINTMKRSILSFSLLILFGGCSLFATTLPQDTLYYRMGGNEGVQKFVDSFNVVNISDPRINPRLMGLAADTRRHAKYRNRLIHFVCNRAGGGCDDASAEVTMEIGRIPLSAPLADFYLQNFSTALNQTDWPTEDRSFLLKEFTKLLSSSVPGFQVKE